jgi:hypothetical protein
MRCVRSPHCAWRYGACIQPLAELDRVPTALCGSPAARCEAPKGLRQSAHAHRPGRAAARTTNMLDRYDTAQTLLPLTTRLPKISKRVGDEAFNAQTDAWNMGLQFYSLLRRRAQTDGQLATNIEPIGKMFAYRGRCRFCDRPEDVRPAPENLGPLSEPHVDAVA